MGRGCLGARARRESRGQAAWVGQARCLLLAEFLVVVAHFPFPWVHAPLCSYFSHFLHGFVRCLGRQYSQVEDQCVPSNKNKARRRGNLLSTYPLPRGRQGVGVGRWASRPPACACAHPAYKAANKTGIQAINSFSSSSFVLFLVRFSSVLRVRGQCLSVALCAWQCAASPSSSSLVLYCLPKPHDPQRHCLVVFIVAVLVALFVVARVFLN